MTFHHQNHDILAMTFNIKVAILPAALYFIMYCLMPESFTYQGKSAVTLG